MIIIPKYKDVYLGQYEARVLLKGLFRIQKGKGDLITFDSGWNDNLILDAGKNYIGDSGNYLAYCHVGSGSTPPVITNTALETFVAATNTVQAAAAGAQGGAPYYGWATRTLRFGEGDAAGNLSEVGIGWGASGSTLFSRALIVDGGGSPTTITVLSDEWLDVSYELRQYPPLVDVIDTQVLDGETYDTTLRAAMVTSSFNWDVKNQAMGKTGLGASYYRVYDGNLGAITTSPSGSFAEGPNPSTGVVNSAYVNNSYQRDMTITYGLNEGNLGAGIRSLRFTTTGGGFQIQFDNQSAGETIPKDATKQLVLDYRLSWDRTP
jgi:hypothetical protein